MNCKIILKDSKGNVIGDLTKEVVDKLALNSGGNITQNDILLYELGETTEGERRQEIVLNILRSNIIDYSHDDPDDNDAGVIKSKKLSDEHVTGRSAIVVKQGNTDGFDEKQWEDKIKTSIRVKTEKDNVGATDAEIEEIVNKSFQDAKDYNDKSSAFGQDIHKIAEIIFSMDLNDSDSVMIEISKRKSEFKTDITGIIENEHIRTEAVDYLLRLKRNIETTHGSGCKFLTESAYGVENLNTEGSYAAIKSKELKGIIDLIVVDKNGEIHLYDFKTSAKRYGDWSQYKKKVTALQLYTYKKMLETKGLHISSMNCLSIPLKINNEYNPDTKRYAYKLIGVHEFNRTTQIIPMHPDSNHKAIVDNWFPRSNAAPKPEEWLETEQTMNEIFITGLTDADSEFEAVDYYFTKDSKGELIPNEERLSEFGFYKYSKGHRLYPKNDSDEKGYRYAYRVPGDATYTLCKNAEDLRNKLKTSLEMLSSERLDSVSRLAHAFAEEYTRANGEPNKINYNNILGSNKDQQIWLKNEVSHYLENGNFELNLDPVYLKQGYLLWRHKTLGFVECVVLSPEYLMQTKRLAKGTTILGKIMDDGHVDKKEIMTATSGNIALMKFMNFLANSEGTKKWCKEYIVKGKTIPCKIASIRVINPYSPGAKEIRPNLRFIVDNYEALCNNSERLLKDKQLQKLDVNLFYNDPQSLALQAVAQCEDLKPIYDEFDTTNFSFDYKKVDDVLEFVDKCLNELVGPTDKAQYQDLENFNTADPKWRAIFYLINIRNALHGHTYIAELGSGRWFEEGAPTGLMMSAPGMSTSTTLRTFDEINKSFVDSVIQAVNKYGKKSKDACIAMYKHHGMDKLLGGPGNAEFYYNLFETEPNPDPNDPSATRLARNFILKHPDTIGDDTQRKVVRQFMILNYRLTLLSQGSKHGLEEFSEQEENEICRDPQWLQVPLMDAAFSRQLYNHHKTSGSWFQTVKYAIVNKWREMGNLYQDVMVDDLKEFGEEVNNYLRGAYTIDKRATWNMFNYARTPGKRYNLLAKFGPERFETNLEIVMDNMLVAFFKEYYSKQYATQLSALRLELAYAKRAGQDVTAVSDAFDLAVRTKFYGESPMPEDLQKIFRPLARLKGIFSILQIGGKAVSMMKELVYGTFIGFSNTWGETLPGLDAATYWKAFWYVCGESFKSARGVSKLNHLQMQYHIANYGLSQIADQRRYNFLGLRNFGSDTLFLTATSPDFFHRMIVLVGKMMADGTWDTYGFAEDDPDGNGELKYDVMKDPRFEKFTKIKDENDPEYWQQKAMFEQYVNEFNKAGFIDENGKKLTVEPDENGNYYLPRPYLQREVDTFKNYADMLYGHYDEESKAMVNDTFLGAFWLQYKTFVTAKVERYGMKPGVYNTHLLKQQYADNGEALYLKIVEENGELHRYVVPESQLTPKDIELRKNGTKGNEKGESVTAYIQWEGIPMEGILHSMGSLSRTLMRVIKGDEGAWGEFKLIWEDPTKRSNLLVALNDLIFMGLLGMIGSTLFGMYNDLDFTEAWNNESAVRQLVRAGNWAENGLYDIFVGAMQDGPITNTISSMFQAPPIMTSIERAWKDSVNLLTGDSSAFEFLTNEVGALRIFDGMAQAAAAE